MRRPARGDRRGRIGDHSYLGSNIYYPAAGKTGANCLLATKAMVPIDGPVRENVGLLGSPCFEIPRVVELGKTFAMGESTRQRRLKAKNRYNILTMAGFLLSIWLWLFALLLSEFVTVSYFHLHGALATFAYGVFASLFTILWFGLVERASLGFKRLTPQLVSMYDEHFWHHERHWKFCGSPLPFLFKGTPFKNLISRLLGVKVGRKVFDDGCRLHDKTLIEIGDFTNLNEGCVIQGHSLEERVFKSDYVKIGSGCSIGNAAFVHYGVIMGDNVVLDPDSFLMKGEILDHGTHWRGNPAKAVRDLTA